MQILLPQLTSEDYFNSLYYPLLDSQARRIVLYGSRNSAKTFFIVQKLIYQALTLSYFKCLLVRKVYDTISFSQWAKIKSVAEMLGVDHLFEFHKSPYGISVKGSNNVFICRGMDKAEKTKSIDDPTHAWYEEADQLTEEDYDIVVDSLRNPHGIKTQEYFTFNSSCGADHWIIKRWFPRPDTFEKPDGSHTYIKTGDPELVIVHSAYYHNEHIDDEAKKEHSERKHKNRTKYEILSLGLLKVDRKGTIFNQQNINEHRRTDIPKFTRLVIAFDPAVSSSELSDEHGIVATARGVDNHGYVLEDQTALCTPTEAAERAIAMYHKLQADAVVVEKNNGGDWIRDVFNSIDSRVNIIMVHASRGKRTRAEPVAALYDKGLIHHVGYLTELENEITTWVPTETTNSPNRLDAMVWGFTELFLKEPGKITPRRGESRLQSAKQSVPRW